MVSLASHKKKQKQLQDKPIKPMSNKKQNQKKNRKNKKTQKKKFVRTRGVAGGVGFQNIVFFSKVFLVLFLWTLVLFVFPKVFCFLQIKTNLFYAFLIVFSNLLFVFAVRWFYWCSVLFLIKRLQKPQEHLYKIIPEIKKSFQNLFFLNAAGTKVYENYLFQQDH